MTTESSVVRESTALVRSTSRAEFRVDLRPLEMAGVVHVDRFRLGVEVVNLPSAFAVSIAGLFDTPEGKMGFRADRRRVDVRDARIEIGHCPKGRVDVARVQRARESVLHVVIDSN